MVSRGLAVLTRKDDTAHLVERVRALREATELCAGRVSDEVLAEAKRVIAQTDRRLAVSGAATVVALAGSTGSGKSSIFNALSGTSLAAVGVRRPTTSAALACTWGDDSAEELLDWLQIPRRHALESDPALATALDGLALLDLPDHDSTELSHRLEVDRLVQLVDMMIWVVDPQKYADAALHDRYIRPFATHADVMMVVLNQVDRLNPAERDQCMRDLRRLLAAEGMRGVEVLAVSTVTGEGMDVLRDKLAKAVVEKKVAARRLAEAAGIPVVTEAVAKAWRMRGGLATGWPVLAWVAKFKPDPLRRLHLDRLGAGRRQKQIDPSRVGRTSLPATSGVQKARVDTAIRALADEASDGLNRGWADALKAAARSAESVLPDALDRAVATTDLDLKAHRGWWQVVRVVQWLLVAAVVGGLGWLGVEFLLAYLQLPPLPEITWWGFPAPTVLVIGGVIAGLLVAGLARIGVEVGARRRARYALRALRRSIAKVSSELVVGPVEAERDRYERARIALERAQA